MLASLARRWPQARIDYWRWAWLLANSVAVYFLIAFWWDKGVINPHLSSDGAAYWGVRDGVLYEVEWPSVGYVYSPAFAQAIWPLVQLSLPAFMALWVGIQTLAVAWLAGPILAAMLVLWWEPLSLTNLWAGNIYPLMAVALSVSFRWPAAWSFLLLTKITPGVGLVWYTVRREWRQLWIAVGVTAVIVAVSFALWPSAWSEWIGMLAASSDNPPLPGALQIPLAVRLPVAIGVMAFAAWRGCRWLVPVGVLLALPQIGWSASALLLACLPLIRGRWRYTTFARSRSRRDRW